MRRTLTLRSALAAVLLVSSTVLADVPPHGAILFVPDGLRAAVVDKTTAPTLAAIRDQGVNFRNSHSLFPTFTTANASAFATGHGLGDTGDFSNTIYSGFPVQAAKGGITPFLENDPVLAEMDGHFGGNYVDEESVLAAARDKGLSTAAIGKLGPVAIQDLTALSGQATLIVDDATGHDGGVKLPPEWSAALQAAGIAGEAPGRGDNGNSGTFQKPGTTVANVDQQRYFVDVATKVALPRFKQLGKPFLLVFWSRDPDGSQHNQGDSLGKLSPGINGATSLAGIKNADSNLAQIRATLKDLGMTDTTDIIVAADHGFSTISKGSKTSPAAKEPYDDVAPKELPPGFLAIDLAQALGTDYPQFKLYEPTPDHTVIDWHQRQHPKGGSGIIATDPAAPDLVVAANGGSDLIYLPQANARELVPKTVKALLAQDYVSGLFVDDDLGNISGTLPLSAIGLKGKARTPVPAIVVSFRSFSTGCAKPERCTAEVADTTLQQGQGMHGSFSRADTWNFMAASGPSFRRHFTDPLPASNADIGRTLAQLLHLDIQANGPLSGRVLSESLKDGKAEKVSRCAPPATKPAEKGQLTVLKQQCVGSEVYTDAAGFRGQTVGLDK